MNTLVALKPAALALSACGIAAAVMVASQVGMTPFASAQSGKGPAIELQVDGEDSSGEPADPAAVAVDVQRAKKEAAASDPFGGEMAGPAGGFGRGVYGGEGGVLSGMDDPFGTGGGFGGEGMGPSATRSSLPHVVDLKPRSAAEVRLESALRANLPSVGFNFTETPLSEFVSFLRDEYELEVQLDTQALDDAGMSPDNVITIHLRNVRLDSALDLLLEQHDLTYIIHNEVLLITTEDRAMTTLEPRAYPVDLISGISGQEVEKLIEVIQSTVAPDTWKENGGGEGAIALIGDRLVIRQTYAVHREINELLSQLRDAPKENAGKPGTSGH